MKVIDSNLVIHAAEPGHAALRAVLATAPLAVSAVSLVEVLGYHKLDTELKAHYETFFAAVTVLPVTLPVVWRAVGLRQRKKMSLGDALIAATALEHGRDLWTQNLADFVNIPGLHVTNPLAAGKA